MAARHDESHHAFQSCEAIEDLKYDLHTERRQDWSSSSQQTEQSPMLSDGQQDFEQSTHDACDRHGLQGVQPQATQDLDCWSDQMSLPTTEELQNNHGFPQGFECNSFNSDIDLFGPVTGEQGLPLFQPSFSDSSGPLFSLHGHENSDRHIDRGVYGHQSSLMLGSQAGRPDHVSKPFDDCPVVELEQMNVYRMHNFDLLNSSPMSLAREGVEVGRHSDYYTPFSNSTLPSETPELLDDIDSSFGSPLTLPAGMPFDTAAQHDYHDEATNAGQHVGHEPLANSATGPAMSDIHHASAQVIDTSIPHVIEDRTKLCPLTDSEIRRRYFEHVESSGRVQKSKCNAKDCGRVLQGPKSASRHWRAKHWGLMAYSCSLCNRQFSRRDHCHRHILKPGRYHASLRPTSIGFFTRPLTAGSDPRSSASSIDM